MRRLICSALLSLAALATAAAPAAAAELYPTAILPFQERGNDVKGLGAQASDLLFAGLIANPSMYLVDREDLQLVLQEQALNASGAVNPAEATRLGQLTGAKILVTGSVLQAGDKLFLVAKVIGTETSRVLGASVKGDLDDSLDTLAEKLAEDVAAVIEKNAESLMPKTVTRDQRLAALRRQLGDGKRPLVWISIDEQHVGRPISDPAAQTEMAWFCTELGFEVLDDPARRREADVHLVGEGFSEFTARVGALAPVKARLEVKAVDPKTGRVLAVDRQTSVAIDVNEHVAGKSALQEASAQIAERLLPKLVKP